MDHPLDSRKRPFPHEDHPELMYLSNDYYKKRTRTKTRSYSSRPNLAPAEVAPVPLEKIERRRVNPEALAARLGPALVAELDALITPGSIEMPSFEARRDIQIRFNVDRRHIYDYYHAKGLRVVKDDKIAERLPAVEDSAQTQDSRFRALPPRRATLQRGMPSSVHCASPARSALVTPTTKRLSRLRKAPQPKEHRSMSLGHEHLSTMSSSVADLLATYLQNDTCPNFTFPEAYDLNTRASFQHSYPNHDFDSVQVHQELGDPRGMVGPMQAYHSITVEPSPAISATYSNSTESSEALPTPPPLDIGDLLAPEFADELTAGSMLPLDEHHLSKKEREETYLFFSFATGPPSGVQESVGTYKSFMHSQAKDYFGDLKESRQTGPPPVAADLSHTPEPGASCSLFGERRPAASGEEDFKKWLMPPRRRSRDLLEVEKVATPEPFDLLAIMSAPSPPPEAASNPLMEYPNVPTRRAPTSYTSPEDFAAYPNADFHIRGVPIISHNKSKIQLEGPFATAAARQPLAPQVLADQMLQPSFVPAQQAVLPPPVMGVSCDPYVAAQAAAGQALSLPRDENFPQLPHGQQFALCAPGTQDQLYMPLPVSDQGILQHAPLFAPTPSLPKAGWLGWEQGRTSSGTRLRGFSSSGDL